MFRIALIPDDFAHRAADRPDLGAYSDNLRVVGDDAPAGNHTISNDAGNTFTVVVPPLPSRPPTPPGALVEDSNRSAATAAANVNGPPPSMGVPSPETPIVSNGASAAEASLLVCGPACDGPVILGERPNTLIADGASEIVVHVAAPYTQRIARPGHASGRPVPPERPTRSRRVGDA